MSGTIVQSTRRAISSKKVPDTFFVLLFSATVGLLLMPEAALAAHPFHISVAELEWNPESRRIEVSLKLQSLDTDQALSRMAKKRVNIETVAEPEKLLAEFLTKHFYLVAADQVDVSEPRQPKLADQAERSKVHYVGHELEVTWLWVFFELELDDATVARLAADQGDWVLVNSVLLDITEGQINTVSIRHDSKKVSKRTTIKQPWLQLKPAELGVTVETAN